MKIQNTTQKKFLFEGIEIEPNEIKDVSDLIGQRLLALWWHRGLELVEDTPAPMGEFPAEESVQEVQNVQEVKDDKEEDLICEKCQTKFESKSALSAHKRFSKTCK